MLNNEYQIAFMNEYRNGQYFSIRLNAEKKSTSWLNRVFGQSPISTSDFRVDVLESSCGY